jgi:hypothetical protein
MRSLEEDFAVELSLVCAGGSGVGVVWGWLWRASSGVGRDLDGWLGVGRGGAIFASA